MALHFDTTATALVIAQCGHQPDDAVLVVSIDRIVARGSVQTISVCWSRHAAAERRRTLIAAAPIAGIPVFLHARLHRYLQWHNATVMARRCLWRERLIVDDEIALLVELARWEWLHPGIAQATPATGTLRPALPA